MPIPKLGHTATLSAKRAKDIKLNSMEEKLNKTIDMLNNMQDYLVENRIIARRTSKLIDGRDITDEELAAERLKLEAIKNGK